MQKFVSWNQQTRGTEMSDETVTGRAPPQSRPEWVTWDGVSNSGTTGADQSLSAGATQCRELAHPGRKTNCLPRRSPQPDQPEVREAAILPGPVRSLFLPMRIASEDLFFTFLTWHSASLPRSSGGRSPGRPRPPKPRSGRAGESTRARSKPLRRFPGL